MARKMYKIKTGKKKGTYVPYYLTVEEFVKSMKKR
jgi:hypothetical protein